MSMLPHNLIQDYQQHGAILLKNAFTDWVDVLAKGIERNMAKPSIHAADNVLNKADGRFFDDYCNWQDIPEFKEFIFASSIGQMGRELMQSEKAQLFHDHILIKEPYTQKETPWHQDSPYYFCEGEQTVSFWIVLDEVDNTGLRCIKGSHKWDKLVCPVRWLDDSNFYHDTSQYYPVPEPDKYPDIYDVLSWPMQPGDAIAFHFKTVHGAYGNMSAKRRRAFSLRLLGDDVRYVTRPGPTSPPFTGHNMHDGDKLRDDWFPDIASYNYK